MKILFALVYLAVSFNSFMDSYMKYPINGTNSTKIVPFSATPFFTKFTIHPKSKIRTTNSKQIPVIKFFFLGCLCVLVSRKQNSKIETMFTPITPNSIISERYPITFPPFIVAKNNIVKTKK